MAVLLLSALLGAVLVFGRGVPAVSDTQADSVRVRLTTPARARAGSPSTLTLTIENLESRRLDLYLRGRELTVDIVVTDATGAQVFHLLEGQTIPAVVRLQTLQAREVFEVSAMWFVSNQRKQPLPPGTYTIRATLLAEDSSLSASQRVEVR